LGPSLWPCGEAEDHGREGTVVQNCSPHGGWEAERETDRKVERTRCIFLGIPTVAYFLQLDPISSFHYLPIIPSLQIQNCHDPITSPKHQVFIGEKAKEQGRGVSLKQAKNMD
jgi:hypothetical protein